MAKLNYKNKTKDMSKLAGHQQELEKKVVVDQDGEILQDTPKIEPKPTKRSIEFDEHTQEVFFITEDGIEIVMGKPRTRQLVSVRKIMKKYEPELADKDGMDEELMARIFSVACVKQYGEKTNMSYEDYLDLSMVDGLLMARGLEFYQQDLEALQRLV